MPSTSSILTLLSSLHYQPIPIPPIDTEPHSHVHSTTPHLTHNFALEERTLLSLTPLPRQTDLANMETTTSHTTPHHFREPDSPLSNDPDL